MNLVMLMKVLVLESKELHVKRSNYLKGKCRKVYKLNEMLDQSLQESDASMSGVCSSCASSLTRIADGFQQLTHRGTELKKRKRSLKQPKNPDHDYYRNVSMQNEWIRGNLFDAMGNYLFCHTCMSKHYTSALSVYPVNGR